MSEKLPARWVESQRAVRAALETASDRAGALWAKRGRDPREAIPTIWFCALRRGEPDWPGMRGMVVERIPSFAFARVSPREVRGRSIESGNPDTVRSS